MKRIIIISLVLALMLLFVSWSFAAWNEGGFKNSPLFKYSLNEAVVSMENQGNEVAAEAENMDTSRPKCNNINAPETALCQTSEETCEGNPTCYLGTCSGITCPSLTCMGTCESTCYGNTCESTCVGNPGVCDNHRFYGTNYWHHGGSNGNIWYPGWGPYGIPGGLPYDYFIDDCGNDLRWSGGGWQHLNDGWDPSDGSYDKTLKREKTKSKMYDIKGWVYLWYRDGTRWIYDNDIYYNQGPAQSQNQHNFHYYF